MNTEQIKREKQKLREYYLGLRKSLSADEYRSKSDAIKTFLTRLKQVQSARTIHCYASNVSQREVDTWPIISWILNESKMLVMPVISDEPGEMIHRQVLNPNLLIENRWGIKEPEEGKRIDPSVPDVIIVPMVAADRTCNRLGYGKGYYDRFLARTDAYKIGLTFRNCIALDGLPVEPEDVKLNIIVTEKGVIF
jgi:5-formyltetrahydrofolate cyclo-ligase